MTDLKLPRVLLKLSGEALAGDKGFGFDFDVISGSPTRSRMWLTPGSASDS